MTKSSLAKTFLDWLQDAYIPEEFFFATLSRVSMTKFISNNAVVQGMNF